MNENGTTFAVEMKYLDPISGEWVNANIAYYKGLPAFVDHVVFTAPLDPSNYAKSSSTEMSHATKYLRDVISKNPEIAESFNKEQLAAIENGDAKIPDFTWHHNANPTNFQLLPTPLHDAVKHNGDWSLRHGK